MNEPLKVSPQEKFNKLISFLIATTAIIVAVTVSLQSYASGQAQEANRTAQELSIQATEKRVTGAVQFSYHWQGAFQNFREVHLQSISADKEGDTAAMERYSTVRDLLIELSPLLQPPYFDAAKGELPNSRQFESDLYLVDGERLKEQSSAESEVGRAWSNLSNVFIIQLTLLTVALSLYGLSNTLKGRMRAMFVIIGSIFVLFVMAWMAIALILPRPKVATPAIDAYANGVGQAYQGNYDKAIALFDKAIAAKPDYANALYQRASANLKKGNYAQTAADFEAAIKAGRDDENARRNLAWTYYLIGRFDDAKSINKQLLQDKPNLVGVQMNLGLVLLVQGDIDNARAMYDQAISEAARQVSEARAAGAEPPSSLWLDLDGGADGLRDLLDGLNHTPRNWTRAPALDLLPSDPAPIAAFASDEMKAIKEARVSLEYQGKLPDSQANIQVQPFRIGEEVYDEEGNYAGFNELSSFPYGTTGVTVTFDYTGLVPGQHVLWKVYRDGVENRSLRDDWKSYQNDLGESGNWFKWIGYFYTNVFVMTPGEYSVELYVDSRLVQQASFIVEQP